MKKKFITLFTIFILCVSNSTISLCDTLVLPDSVMRVLIEEGMDEVYNAILHECTRAKDDNYISQNQNNFTIFQFKNIELNNVHYESIEGTDGNINSTIRMTYKCELGERIEDSKTFVDTVNVYKKNYVQIPRTPKQEKTDISRGRKTISYKSNEENIRVTLYYYHGDVSKIEFPQIEVWISKTK